MTDVHIDTPTTGDVAGKGPSPAVPVAEGHPIHILMKEHEMVLSFAHRLADAALSWAGRGDAGGAPLPIEEMRRLFDHLVESESHYVREENVLFPVIERHGITEPPKVMWMEHDQIRALKKELGSVMAKVDGASHTSFVEDLVGVTSRLSELLASHFSKEDSILFPASLRVVAAGEWDEIRHGFDELGYCCFTPGVPDVPSHGGGHGGLAHGGGDPPDSIPFETGALTKTELTAILDSLPVDISFVDKDDRVRYFNQAADRIFPRAKAVIGRTVQNCHPQKSVDRVQAILDGFRSGTLPKAEFWIPVGEKFVFIRYLPVRDAAGGYLGCLEVTQDIAPIKKIEGEKRLL
jgi:PAS domain S-box-containing protein